MMDTDTLRAGIKFHAANIETLNEERQTVVDALDAKIDVNRHLIHAAYAELLDLPATDLEIGSWECPPTLDKWDRKNKDRVKRYEARWSLEELARIRLENPLGACVYNHAEDPSLDFCLFCGHPDERK